VFARPGIEVTPLTPAPKDLEDLLRSAATGSDPSWAAYGESYLFEERVSGHRQVDYETALRGQIPDLDAWDRWHRNEYLPKAIHRPVPETFTVVNSAAAHAADLAEDQWLVRVENLTYALRETGLDIDRLQEILDVAAGGPSGGKFDSLDAEAQLQGVCDSLNRNPNGVRPRFAGFFQDVEDTMGLPDWPDQVRDRFGLAHIDTGPKATLPIAVMRYPVREVLAAAAKQSDAIHPICVPTVLDHEFTAWFMPAPRDLPYGRTLQLAGDPGCEAKIAEVLHLRLRYKPRHIYRVGAVTEPLTGLVNTRLKPLRAEHLFCLQYDSGRDDFGQLPPGWTAP
jgi:hypothetical protein